jgi:hypothetical protein
MKVDPTRPVYEPRHLTVRRELFRFADQHKLYLAGQHHPHKPELAFHGLASEDDHWVWLLRSRWAEDEHYQIPVSELLALLFTLYPNRPVHLHIPEGEVGTEVLYALIPVVVQHRER